MTAAARGIIVTSEGQVNIGGGSKRKSIHTYRANRSKKRDREGDRNMIRGR
jgi:hypothetical protein